VGVVGGRRRRRVPARLDVGIAQVATPQALVSRPRRPPARSAWRIRSSAASQMVRGVARPRSRH
jgi:hypothetical protein